MLRSTSRPLTSSYWSPSGIASKSSGLSSVSSVAIMTGPPANRSSNDFILPSLARHFPHVDAVLAVGAGQEAPADVTAGAGEVAHGVAEVAREDAAQPGGEFLGG